MGDPVLSDFHIVLFLSLVFRVFDLCVILHKRVFTVASLEFTFSGHHNLIHNIVYIYLCLPF